jgi:hypothetical protein
MGRLYLNERLLKQIGLDEATVTTLRKLTEFIEAQEAIAAAEAEIEANGTAIDAANTDITAALAPFVRENQAARPAYTPYAGQNFSAAYVEAEAQATDDAVLALSTAFNALLTRLDTVNLLT